MSFGIRCAGKLNSEVLQDAPANLSSGFFLVTRTMQVLLVLGFYHLDKKDKIHRLIHDSGSKIAVQVSRLVKKLRYALKFYRVTAGNVHSFRIRSKETLRIMYPKYPVLDKPVAAYQYCVHGSRLSLWILIPRGAPVIIIIIIIVIIIFVVVVIIIIMIIVTMNINIQGCVSLLKSKNGSRIQLIHNGSGFFGSYTNNRIESKTMTAQPKNLTKKAAVYQHHKVRSKHINYLFVFLKKQRNVFLEIRQEVKENKFGLKKIAACLLYYVTFAM